MFVGQVQWSHGFYWCRYKSYVDLIAYITFALGMYGNLHSLLPRCVTALCAAMVHGTDVLASFAFVILVASRPLFVPWFSNRPELLKWEKTSNP